MISKKPEIPSCSARGRYRVRKANLARPLLRCVAAVHHKFGSGLSSFLNTSPNVLWTEDLQAQFFEQCLGILQIGGVEALGKPVEDLSEHRARLLATALLCEEPREAGSRA